MMKFYFTNIQKYTFRIICLLKGHGHDFHQILFFYFYYLQCLGNAFLVIK